MRTELLRKIKGEIRKIASDIETYMDINFEVGISTAVIDHEIKYEDRYIYLEGEILADVTNHQPLNYWHPEEYDLETKDLSLFVIIFDDCNNEHEIDVTNLLKKELCF